MPTWLIIALVKLALQFGVPIIVDHLPKQWQDVVHAIFDHAAATGQSPVDVAHNPPAHIERMCTGAGCPSDLVK